MNTTGKGFFQKGHTLSKGKGRPRKSHHISALEQLREEVRQMPDQLLHGIAKCDRNTLKQFAVPFNQVKELHKVLASGLLAMRGNHE